MISFKLRNFSQQNTNVNRIDKLEISQQNTNVNRIDKLEFSQQNVPYIYYKDEYIPVVPLKVYMTWGYKSIPPKMKNHLEKLKRENPEFEFIIFDDEDCKKFLTDNFNKEILWGFNKLVPGAYKADLWRLCILYINGGFYIDIKLKCLNGFKLIELSESEHFVMDRPPNYILNSFMVCKAGNPFLKKCIDEIITNIKTNYYGNDCLSPTGPGNLGKVMTHNNFNLNIDLSLPQHGEFIVYKGIGIMKGYDGYGDERKRFSKTRHYGELWNSKLIYNKDF